MSHESALHDMVSGDSPITASTTSQDYGSGSTQRSSVGSFADFGNVNHAFRADIRRERLQKYAHEPNGFNYHKNTCYRNAVLIMLMTSDVFMRYVNWHVRQIDELQSLADYYFQYTDVLVELKRLYEVFWNSNGRDEREAAMSVFWTYVISEGNPLRWPPQGPQDTQQDAQEFLPWIFDNLRLQVQAQNELVEIVPEFDEIIRVRHVQRYTCTSCGAQPSVKHRQPNPELDDFLMLNPNNGRNKSTSNTAQQATATIDQLLVSSIKELVNGRRCAECETKWVDRKKTLLTSEALDAAVAENNAKRGRQWTHLQRLPEVMFMWFRRYKYDSKGSKDSTIIEVAEEFDTASILDKTVLEEWGRNTRYKLRSVLSHRGGLESGHYRNHVLVTQHGGDQWFCIDGTRVARVDFEKINEDHSRWTPYLLCWERIVLDDPLAVASPIRQPSPPTGIRSRSVLDHGSPGSTGAQSHFSARNSQLASQDGPANGTRSNLGRHQPPGAPLTEPSRGLLCAKVTIAGKTYTFEDLDVTLPPQFDASMRKRRAADVKVQAKLITRNLARSDPKIMTYDLIKAQSNKADTDGLKFLTQRHVDRQSKERMKKGVQSRWKFPEGWEMLQAESGKTSPSG